MKTSESSSDSLFPTSYPEYVYNFAYGSNMNPNVLVGRRKIQPIESIPGVLEGWQLVFNLRGIPGVEPCFGNIRENPDSEIHGVLHKMTSHQFRHLLATEGGGGIDKDGYIPRKVDVHAYDGRMIDAYALVVRPASPATLKHRALPSRRYVNHLRDGAKHHNIHPLYLQYLQSLPSIERNKLHMLLVVIEALSIIILFSIRWVPVVIFYLCKNQGILARNYFFKLISANLWRIYHLLNPKQASQPYYSPPFARGSTDFKEKIDSFRTKPQINRET